jgi:hypothetical protein
MRPFVGAAEHSCVAIGIVRLSDGGASKALVRGQTYGRLLMGETRRGAGC